MEQKRYRHLSEVNLQLAQAQGEPGRWQSPGVAGRACVHCGRGFLCTSLRLLLRSAAGALRKQDSRGGTMTWHGQTAALAAFQPEEECSRGAPVRIQMYSDRCFIWGDFQKDPSLPDPSPQGHRQTLLLMLMPEFGHLMFFELLADYLLG